MNRKTGDIPRSLRILAVSALWQGADDYGLVRAFRRAGHSVQVVSEDNFFPGWRSRSMRAIRRLGARFLEAEFNNALLADARSLAPDLLFVFKGAHLWPEVLEQIKALGAITIQFYPDVSFHTHGPNLCCTLPRYDWVFTTKSFGLDDMFSQLGVERSSFLPHGFDPETHRTCHMDQKDRDKFSCDFSFIGNWSDKKQRLLERVDDALPGADFRIWGPDSWLQVGDALLNRFQKVAPTGLEYSKAIQASKINIAILSEARIGASSDDLTTSRTFQIPASGGFMLHERTEEAMGYFSEGRECAYFSDADELIEKIGYYLVHEEERRVIAEAGHRRCITSGYSADDRINSIIAKYRELRRRRKP